MLSACYLYLDAATCSFYFFIQLAETVRKTKSAEVLYRGRHLRENVPYIRSYMTTKRNQYKTTM